MIENVGELDYEKINGTDTIIMNHESTAFLETLKSLCEWD